MLFCNRFNSVSVFLLLLFKQFCLARFRFVSEFWLLCFQATTQHTKTLPATMEIPIRSQNEREYNLSFIGYPCSKCSCTKNSNKNREDKKRVTQT